MNWDTQESWFDKPWQKRSWANHLHDKHGQFLKPTARRCRGVKESRDWRDHHVGWGCVILLLLLLLFGSKPGFDLSWLHNYMDHQARKG